MTKRIIAIAIIIINCQFSIVNSLSAQPVAGSSPRIVSLNECVSTMRKENIKAVNARNNVLLAEEFQKYTRTKYLPSVTFKAFQTYHKPSKISTANMTSDSIPASMCSSVVHQPTCQSYSPCTQADAYITSTNSPTFRWRV